MEKITQQSDCVACGIPTFFACGHGVCAGCCISLRCLECLLEIEAELVAERAEQSAAAL
jgi:hypothetical protein